MRKVFFISSISLIFLGFLTMAPIAFAVNATNDSGTCDFSKGPCPYVPLAPIPHTGEGGCTPGDSGCAPGVTLKTYLEGIFKGAVAIAGILAFLYIVIGGFQYMSTDAISGKSEGKEEITRALGGFLLAVIAYIILRTINPQLVELNLDFGPYLGKKPVEQNFIGATSAEAELAQTDALAKQLFADLDAAEIEGASLVSDTAKSLGLGADLAADASKVITNASLMQTVVNQLPEAERPEAYRQLSNAKTSAEAIRDYASERSRLLAAHLKAQQLSSQNSPEVARQNLRSIESTLSSSYSNTTSELDQALTNLRNNGAPQQQIQRIEQLKTSLDQVHKEVQTRMDRYRQNIDDREYRVPDIPIGI